MKSRETDNFRNDRGQGDDYRYSEEAQAHDLQLIWKCDKCKRERRDYPGVNEGGKCFCGGEFQAAGESYVM